MRLRDSCLLISLLLLFNLKVEDINVFIAAETIMRGCSNLPCVDSDGTKNLFVWVNLLRGGAFSRSDEIYINTHTHTHREKLLQYSSNESV